jgi:hypothetical protein
MQENIFGNAPEFAGDIEPPNFPATPSDVRVDDAAAMPLVEAAFGPKKGKDSKTGMWWLTLSAFHKELRRSDPDRAYAYARTMKHTNNNSFIKRYLHAIGLEETRNLSLIRYMVDELKGRESDRWHQFLYRFLRSAKRWELPYSLESERLITKVRYEADWIPLSTHEVSKAVQSVSTPEEGYRLFLSCNDSERLRYAFYAAYTKRLPADVADLLERWIDDYRFGPDFNVMQSLVDFDFWPELLDVGAKEFDRGEPSYGIDYYDPPPYAYDEHNWAGKRRLKAVADQWGDIATSPQPPGVDVRWGAGQLGCTWRPLAFSKYGERGYRNRTIADTFDGERDLLRMACVQQSRSLGKHFNYP